MTYYLDNDYHVHTEQIDGLQPWEDTDGFFDGKCKIFVEGYRVVPEGCEWKRNDGKVFPGLMIAPWKPVEDLLTAQAAYEEAAAEMADMQAALELLGVTVDE